MSILKCNNLEKNYNTKKVVQDISIEGASGEVIGLLGPNGAGKTTTFYMIVGLIGRFSFIKSPLIKKREIQNTKAMFEIFEPRAFPIAKIVLS